MSAVEAVAIGLKAAPHVAVASIAVVDMRIAAVVDRSAAGCLADTGFPISAVELGAAVIAVANSGVDLAVDNLASVAVEDAYPVHQ